MRRRRTSPGMQTAMWTRTVMWTQAAQRKRATLRKQVMPWKRTALSSRSVSRARLLAVLWALPLVYAIWTAFHPGEFLLALFTVFRLVLLLEFDYRLLH